MDEQQRQLLEELVFSENQKAGIGAQLFFGKLDSNKFLPYPVVPEEDRQRLAGFLTQVQHFADTIIDPSWIDLHSEIPEQCDSRSRPNGCPGNDCRKRSGRTRHVSTRLLQGNRDCRRTMRFYSPIYQRPSKHWFEGAATFWHKRATEAVAALPSQRRKDRSVLPNRAKCRIG